MVFVRRDLGCENPQRTKKLMMRIARANQRNCRFGEDEELDRDGDIGLYCMMTMHSIWGISSVSGCLDVCNLC